MEGPQVLPPTLCWLRLIKCAFFWMCVVMNSITAGGIFCFPLFAPYLVKHLDLSQPELSSIVLAGMMGQYPFAAGWGMLIDRVGPWACSLAASCLFSVSFGTFAYLIEHEGISSHRWLVLLFFLAGSAAVSSYFSALFATRTHSATGGLATSIPLALFGLSPLFLSYVATLPGFQFDNGDFNAPKFIAFLAVGAGLIHFISAFGLRVRYDSPHSVEPNAHDAQLPDVDVSERTPLLKKQAMLPGSPASSSSALAPIGDDGSVLGLLSDSSFWLFAAIVLVITGSAEMVISNIGSIVMTLPGSGSAATQVRLISVANTLARLCSGPLADLISPLGTKDTCGAYKFPTARRLSPFGVRSCGSLPVLSVGTGLAYGAVWAVVPSITGTVWGFPNLGRNFGIVSYAPFIGTPIFTYLYAYIGDEACQGRSCWSNTFKVCAAATGVAFVGTTTLWKWWRDRV
ncbi:putative monocarboxylate transporter mch1 [Ceratobasidium sp. 392]|nr:putative monocarboxylate transporter mch1 [Ceratobasidium sp. 392]